MESARPSQVAESTPMAMPTIAVTPALSTSGEDAVRYELPCGLALKFVDALGTAMTCNEFDSLSSTVPELALAAGVHATTYIEWAQITEGVYRDDDSCWPELVCAPSVVRRMAISACHARTPRRSSKALSELLAAQASSSSAQAGSMSRGRKCPNLGHICQLHERSKDTSYWCPRSSHMDEAPRVKRIP